MINRLLFAVIPLLLVLGLWPASAQQRVDFERQRFDRSRFQRDPTQRPESPSLSTPEAPADPSPPAPPPAREGPEFSFSESPPPTQAPASTGFQGPNATTNARPPFGRPGIDPALQTLIDSPKLDGLPTRIYQDPRDVERLLELQKETGACIFLAFTNPFVNSEKGLFNWYKKHVAGTMAWRRAMRYYLQVEITLPGKKEAQELAAKYNVTKTPVFLVLKPGSTHHGRFWPFVKNPGEDMKLKDIEAILQELKAASTPAYADLF